MGDFQNERKSESIKTYKNENDNINGSSQLNVRPDSHNTSHGNDWNVWFPNKVISNLP